jgi:hypothetical protein
VNPSWFFCLWFPSQILELRGSILGFRCSRVRGVLGGISSIPLDLTSFGRYKLGYGLLMRCSYYPQSLAQVHGAIREIKVWIWGSWPASVVHPELPRLHRSGRCSWPIWQVRTTCGICLGWSTGLMCFWAVVLLVSSWSVSTCLDRFCVGFSFRAICVLGVFLFQGLKKSLRLSGMLIVRLLLPSAWPALSTGLTGAAQAASRASSRYACWCVLAQRVVCWFLGLVAPQWLRGLGQLG